MLETVRRVMVRAFGGPEQLMLETVAEPLPVEQTLLPEGGGHINGAFLEAGLVDELSLLIAPGIDGRHDIPAVFDGISPASGKAFVSG